MQNAEVLFSKVFKPAMKSQHYNPWALGRKAISVLTSSGVYLWQRQGTVPLIKFLLSFLVQVIELLSWAHRHAIERRNFPVSLEAKYGHVAKIWPMISEQKWWGQLQSYALKGESSLLPFLWDYPPWTMQMRTTLYVY